MKRSALGLVALALMAWGFTGVTTSFAAHCTGTTAVPASSHDLFGSCEDGGTTNFGNVHCGAGGTNVTRTNVPMAGALLVRNGGGATGVQVCNDGSGGSVVPIQGRVTVVNHGSGTGGTTTISTDGDKHNAHAGAQSWTRIDVKPSALSCQVRERRGSSGDYWSAQNNDGAGQPLLEDNCIIP